MHVPIFCCRCMYLPSVVYVCTYLLLYMYLLTFCCRCMYLPSVVDVCTYLLLYVYVLTFCCRCMIGKGQQEYCILKSCPWRIMVERSVKSARSVFYSLTNALVCCWSNDRNLFLYIILDIVVAFWVYQNQQRLNSITAY